MDSTTRNPPEIDPTVDPKTMVVPYTGRSVTSWYDARPNWRNKRRGSPEPDTIALVYTGPVREDTHFFPSLDIDLSYWHIVRVWYDEEEDEMVHEYLDGTRLKGVINYYIAVAHFQGGKILAMK